MRVATPARFTAVLCFALVAGSTLAACHGCDKTGVSVLRPECEVVPPPGALTAPLSSAGPESAAPLSGAATPDPSLLMRVDGTAAPAGSGAHKEVPLFNNESGDAVLSGVTAPSTFAVKSGSIHLSSITTYHYVLPGGLKAVGSVGLRGPDGTTFGPYPATGSIGQGGIPNAMWRVTVSLDLPAGTYTIIDSAPATWSSNSGTGGAGMFWTTGYTLP